MNESTAIYWYSQVKDAVASPASFSDFGTAALQRGAALEA